jgi:D-serine deaminase-like pyridoxal phosphate-dependent protein
VVTDLTGLDEIRPGCFVFGDLQQYQLGACRAADLALAVACPVAGVYPEREQLIIHGGAVHFSRDRLVAPTGQELFGYLTYLNEHGWGPPDEENVLISLSQEHGVIQASGELLASIQPGQLILVLPVHACLTGDLFPSYRTLTGQTIARRRSNDSDCKSG